MSVPPRSPRVVPGEASESDSEPELPGGIPGAGGGGAGLKVPGEASETDDEEDAVGGGKPSPPRVLDEGSRGVPSLLQQRLWGGAGRLRGAVGGAVRGGWVSASRRLGALAGRLGSAQAAAAAVTHGLREARRDLRHLADTVDIVVACRLLPEIRGV
ncbi:biogenesis of lysosome-related organelles complex 1 subunit 3 [Patagioenas fasciata]|uniref:biogenesis of lysosome-related organelles complex 1 subunit 3 n=1 Tax=Patagioenas fasciata TaxID=372321 RepID=UPI0032E8CA0E